MAITNATDIAIYIGGVKVACATSAEVNQEMSVRDATCKDSQGNSESLEGLKSWDMSGEGFVDPSATYGYDELVGVMNARTQVSVRWTSATSGVSYQQGTAYVTSLGASAGVEESATFSFSLTGTGALAYISLT
jgi:predicted secreted protein|tara:strand:- start:693 stop:1094 length:402 start_codon:yes stop_codon:yes gene_type:complete